ncbi:MAG: hypothetical protein IJM32_03595 [Ruminococcus sp.]|nr:hypothetical protein [Ruminococcus sp.]
MSAKTKKTIIILCLCVILLPVAFYIFIYLLFLWSMSDDNETVKTEYGDKFKVRRSYTFSEVASDLYSTNSDMHIWIELGIYKDSFKGLAHTDDLTVYNVIGIVIFDDGGGFEELTEDNIDDNPDVAEVLKENIMSENGSFKSFLCLLLRSEKYQSEAKKIIDLVNDWDTKRLAEYGLDETKTCEDWRKTNYMADANTALREWEEKRPKYNDKYNQSKSGW